MSFFRPHAESEFPSCRIVVIGNAAADLEFIVNTLQDAGYESVTVMNDFSVDGFDHSTPQLHHHYPDLIILDLPASDESDERELEQLTRLNTAVPARESISVLALVTDRPEHRASVLEHGADDILVRPLIVEELLARTSILLRTKVLHQHGQQLARQLDQARQLESSTEAEYLRAVVDGMQECVLACDADGQPVFTNAAAARLGLDLLGAEQGPRLTPDLLRSPRGAPLSGDDDPLRRAWHGRPVIDQEVTIDDPRHGRRVLVANANQIVADPGTRLGAVAVLHDVTENHRVMQALRGQVLHDDLTGLPNRVLFLDRLERAVAKAQRDHRPVAVMMLDVRPSPQAGDDLDNTARETVLITLAQRLMMTLRPGDTSARLGDGFGILAAAPVGEGNARLIADRLRGELCHPVTIDGPPVTPELHIGIAISRDAEVPAEQLLQDAQTAAREAGRFGGNRYQLMEGAPRQSFLEQHDLVTDLRNALPEGEFGVHYQSMIDLVGGHIVGVEALARWNRPGQPPVAPARFIPIAAQNGFLATIDSWMLTTACHQLAGWQQADLIDQRFVMSVNISADELAMPGWADQLGRIVRRQTSIRIRSFSKSAPPPWRLIRTQR
jgi:diguanylate cyclase (GGDEF)-like protein